MKQQKKRVIALTLLICVVSAMLQGALGKNQAFCAFSYYQTYVTQKVDGITWQVHGTLTIDGAEKYLSQIDSVCAIIDKEDLDGREIRIPDSITEGEIRADLVMLDAGMFEGSGVTSVILNKHLTKLSDNLFQNCTKLKEVKTVKENQEISVGASCFNGCNALERIDFFVKEVGVAGFSNCKKLKEVSFSSKDEKKIVLKREAFYKNGLEKITFSDNLEEISIGSHAFSGVLVKEIRIPGNVKLGNGAFENCGMLRKLEFFGSVVREDNEGTIALNAPAFGSSFHQEYDQQGNLIEKEVIFHSNVALRDYKEYPSVKDEKGEFVGCSGLTKVTIKGKAELPQYTFQNCINLKNISLEGYVTLGQCVFFGCEKLEKIKFLGGVRQKYGEDYSPFWGSSLKDIYFDDLDCSGFAGVEVNIANSTIENIYYRSQHIKGTISACGNLKKIVLLNPNLTVGEQRYQSTGFIDLKDETTHSHDVIGYSSIEPKLRHTENWLVAYSNQGVFSNIVYPNSMQVEELRYVGTVEKEKIEFSNATVKCANYDNLSEKIQIPFSTDGTDLSGFIVDTSNIPDVLEPGEYYYTITYSGQSVVGKIVVEQRRPCKLNVQWNTENIKELVAGQPVSAGAIVSGASVLYNDGITELVEIEKLDMNKDACVEGDNQFFVSLKGYPEVCASHIANIKANYVTEIKARYIGGEKYIGDTIRIQDIEVYATYKYSDPKLEPMVSATKISTNLLKEEQNEIQIFYGDVWTNLVIPATSVLPVEVFATFDQDHFKYIEGQEVDKKAVHVHVLLNNGTKLENVPENEYEVEVLFSSSVQLTAKVNYKNISSPQFYIPVTPKSVTGIKVEANVVSAVEGSILPKTMIQKIVVTYSNGKSEVIEKDAIDYEQLQLVYEKILPNIENEIAVQYLGCADTIVVIGIPNQIESIYGEYVGTGVAVGTKVPMEEICVYGKNTNGTIARIEKGILLEKDTIFMIGEDNEVIVYYGSMQCRVKVKGISCTPVPETPKPTEIPQLTETPLLTEAPQLTETPKRTEIPQTWLPEETKKPLENTIQVTVAPTMEVSIPQEKLEEDTLPGTVVTASAFSITSNIKGLTLAEQKSYKIFTNKKVLVQVKGIGVSHVKYQIVNKGKTPQEKKWIDVKDQEIVITKTSKACMIYFQYETSEGKIVSAYTKGFFIDKKKATTNVKDGATYKIGKKVVFKDAGGIKSAKLNGKKIKSGKKLTKKGSYVLQIKDYAGNVKKVKFKVKGK